MEGHRVRLCQRSPSPPPQTLTSPAIQGTSCSLDGHCPPSPGQRALTLATSPAGQQAELWPLSSPHRASGPSSGTSGRSTGEGPCQPWRTLLAPHRRSRGRRVARPLPVLPDSQSPRGLPREAGQVAAQVPVQAPLVEAVLPPHLTSARFCRHVPPRTAPTAYAPHPPTAPLRY